MQPLSSSHQEAAPPPGPISTVVLLPSLSFPVAELVKIKGVIHYEERLLCTILLLARPEQHLVYLTSLPVDPAIIDYYLGFLADPDDARRRLHLVAVDEPGARPLTAKVLDHPEVLEQVGALLSDDGSDDGSDNRNTGSNGNHGHAALVPFNVTAGEWRVADALGIPLDGPPTHLAGLGSKTGARRVARRAEVAVAEGEEGLFSLDEVLGAVQRLRARRTGARAAVVKLNHGFSGQGNALVDLAGHHRTLAEMPTTFCAPGESWSSFSPKIAADGAIVEEVLPAAASPSVQLRIAADGSLQVVSTHDQVLGGPGGQVYLGCRFPADRRYRSAITDAAVRVGQVLAAEGVIGPFGIDFLITPGSDGDDVTLSEINLRMGGTTHPFWMARLLTGGTYDVATGELRCGDRSKCYVATDNLGTTALAGCSPAWAVTAVERAGLTYDRRTGTGTVLHLLGALPGFSKLGVSSIGDSLEEADARFDEVSAVLTGLEGYADPAARGAG